MSFRQGAKLVPALLAAARGLSCAQAGALQAAVAPAITCGLLSSTSTFAHRSGLHFSAILQQEEAPVPKLYEPSRKFRSLSDKELWHEAWMYEDRFGTEEDPIVVPSLEDERIIGVTDPEDDNLVVWGILKANEPPRQFIEGGEYYLLKRVPYVAKVGDILEIEASAPKAPLPK